MERQPFFELPASDLCRTFVTSDIAKILDISVYRVRNAMHALKLKGHVEATETGRKCFFTYDESKMIINWLKEHDYTFQKQKEAKPVKKIELDFNELRKQHPLVTDDRCFILNWWPNTECKCFEDL